RACVGDFVLTELVTARSESARLTVADTGTYPAVTAIIAATITAAVVGTTTRELGQRSTPRRMGLSTTLYDATETANVPATCKANRLHPCKLVTRCSQRKMGQ